MVLRACSNSASRGEGDGFELALPQYDVDCPGECLEMDAKQCTLNRDFPRQSNSLDSSGSSRTISISRIAAFFGLVVAADMQMRATTNTRTRIGE
jgi:hypothetical protein